MKKRSILTMIFALVSAFAISASSCSMVGGMTGGSSSKESSVQVESSETSETPEGSESSKPETPEIPDSSDSSDTSETPGTSENPDTSETPDDPETPQQDALKIISPVGEVFPYVDEAKAYLQAGEGADVSKFAVKMDNPQVPVEIKWQFDKTGARKFRVEYGTKADYSDAITVEVGATKRSVEAYNLYKATKYYVRISALNGKGEAIETKEGEFFTTELGPRVMNVEGICNVRDIGGFKTSFGKTIVQGIAYRGGALKDENSRLANGSYLGVTENGKKFMSEVMGIKAELDFRDERESGIKLENGSLIPGAKLTYITAGGYDDLFKGNAGSGQKEVYRKIFSYFSNKENYPLYAHCTAGADRTGTVFYILHAFLGVSELECNQDYEFTSFSIYGVRGGSTGANASRYNEMKRLLNTYEGANLQEKTENYLKSIGVTQTELNNIKAIYFGEEVSEPEQPTLPEENGALTITSPTGEVFPYVDEAKRFLQAGAGVDVYDYYVKVDNPAVPIEVTWTYSGTNIAKFLVEYATEKTFSGAYSIEVGATKRKVELYNLYRGTTYYLRVTAINTKGEPVHTGTGEFYTTELGPRVMNIEGVHNVRDLGGYETSFGKTIVQGIAYRGGSLTDPPKDDHFSNNISEAGKKYMSEVMGIKSELDFRTEEESGITLEQGSVIPGAKLTYIQVGGYTAPFYHGKEGYRQIFSYFANENNYPMYYHCTGGADRTGTVTFLLHALLGVSELECIQGFAFTTYSIYGLRASQQGIYWDSFQNMISLLKGYDGDTLQEKTENYLLSIGVTETEIYNIKAIFFGEPTKVAIEAPASYIKGIDEDLKISLIGSKTPSKLYIGNVETQFVYADKKIIVATEQLPSLPNGKTTCKVIFTDGIEASFEMDWRELNVMSMDNIMTFNSDGKVELTANKTPLTSSGTVGYGQLVVIHASTTTVENTQGGFRIFIGSYGFECRANEVRPYTIDSNGTMKEVARDTGMRLPVTVLNEGNTLYMSVDIVGNTAVLTIRVEGTTTIEHTYTFANRVANEISSENAKMTFWIRTDAVTSLTVYNSTAWKKENN